MVKIPLKYLPVAGIIFLLLIIGYFIIKTGNKGGKDPVPEDLPTGAGLTIPNPHIIQGDPDEGTRFVLDADEGTYSQDKKRVVLINFRLKLEPLESPSIEVIGEKADYDTNENVIRLSGNIQGSSGNGYGFSTEYLTYEQKDDLLVTDEPVRITGPFFSVTGRGLRCHPEKETFKIISDVTGLIEKGSLI